MALLPQTTQPQISKNIQDEKRQKGTGFANINRILGANVGAGQKMGEAVASNLQNIGQNVRSGLAQSQEQFQKQYGEGLGQAQEQIAQAGQFKRQPGESDAAYEQRLASANVDFGKAGETMRSAEYKGPTDIEKSQSLLARAQGVADTSGLARSGVGQGLLLRQTIGPSRYTRGQGALDQFLLGQDTSAQKQIQEARRGIAGLGASAADAIKASREAAQGASSGIQSSKAQTGKELQDQLRGLQTRGTEQAETFRKEAQILSDYLRNFIPSSRSSTEQLSVLSGPDIGSLRGLPSQRVGEQTPEQLQQLQNAQQIKGLVDRASEFGLDLNKFQNLYMEDPGQIQAYVNSVLANAQLGAGGEKFSEQQKLAGKALGGLLQDPETAKRIQESTFDTDVFKSDVGSGADEFRKGLSSARNEDLARQAKINEFINIMKNRPQDQGAWKRANPELAFEIDKNLRNELAAIHGLRYTGSHPQQVGYDWMNNKQQMLDIMNKYSQGQVAAQANLRDMILQDLARRGAK